MAQTGSSRLHFSFSWCSGLPIPGSLTFCPDRFLTASDGAGLLPSCPSSGPCSFPSCSVLLLGPWVARLSWALPCSLRMTAGGLNSTCRVSEGHGQSTFTVLPVCPVIGSHVCTPHLLVHSSPTTQTVVSTQAPATCQGQEYQLLSTTHSVLSLSKSVSGFPSVHSSEGSHSCLVFAPLPVCHLSPCWLLSDWPWL